MPGVRATDSGHRLSGIVRCQVVALPATVLRELPATHERTWRDAQRLTTARADQEFLLRRLIFCRSVGGQPATA